MRIAIIADALGLTLPEGTVTGRARAAAAGSQVHAASPLAAARSGRTFAKGNGASISDAAPEKNAGRRPRSFASCDWNSIGTG